ncbi:hypothetical protein OIO90_001752 [Microbotryomycetes sp. JL221]|nr:hypothetical protein OIO90_001752 [Microbotryomycetes sp. JL221]
MSDLKRASSFGSGEKTSADGVFTTVTTSQHASSAHSVKRVITRRQVNLYAIGGVIGTAVFVSIGGALTKGGPLSLLTAYAVYCLALYCVNEGQGEMVCALPIESSFSRFASKYVADAFGAATAWNYFLCMCSLLCFEITAFHAVCGFWSDQIHPAIIPAAMLVSYCILHLWSSRWFAESEFWIVLMKILLMLGLFMFTLVTMCGGNPIKDAFGFRSWRDPGPVAEYNATGASGQLQGWLACLLNAAFAVAGPDMLSMIGAETINPRKVMPTAFRTVFARLIIFFVLSALAVGILVPSNDPILLAAISEGRPGAGRSPYVAAMTRLQVPILPHIVNAGILTSIYSAGSAFAYNGSRVLHALAVDGYAPAFIKKTNHNGVPWVAFLLTAAIGCLSFLQVSAGSTKVLDWFINCSTSAQLVTWLAMSITYLRWRKAMAVQGFDRSSLPYRSRILPYGTYFAMLVVSIVTLIVGYSVFLKDSWSTADFIFSYFSQFFFLFVLIVRWIYKPTGLVKPEAANLWDGLAEIEEHEESLRKDTEGGVTATGCFSRAKNWLL